MFWIVFGVLAFLVLSIAIFGGSIMIGTDDTHIYCSTPGLVGRWRLIKARRHQSPR